MLSSARLSSAWERIRTSYWFMPTVLSLTAALVSGLLLQLDYAFADRIPSEAWWLYGGDADGARTLMATIIGSMITVVSVVFSITIVSLTLASGQFGSRLLRMFMRDRGNQLVLAVFIATFVYSLLVMRSVRGSDAVQFVPYISVTLAVLLVLTSVGLLIYFIHHVSMSIQADQVVDSVASEVNESIQRLFPDQLGKSRAALAPGDAEPPPRRFPGEASVVSAQREGYLQALDTERLMRVAKAHDLQMMLPLRPGAFVSEGTPIVLAWPSTRVSEEVEKALLQTFVLGRHRTLTQDAEHGVDQLVEIAVRALSPGINDPFTALSCLDRLGAILDRLAGKHFPSASRYDDQGHLRMVADTTSFATFVDCALDLIRENAAASPAVLLRTLDIVCRVAASARTAEQRTVLRRHAHLIHERGLGGFSAEHDKARLEAAYQRSLALLGDETASPNPLSPIRVTRAPS